MLQQGQSREWQEISLALEQTTPPPMEDTVVEQGVLATCGEDHTAGEWSEWALPEAAAVHREPTVEQHLLKSAAPLERNL